MAKMADKNSINRRTFLKNVTLAIGAVTTTSGAATAKSETGEKEDVQDEGLVNNPSKIKPLTLNNAYGSFKNNPIQYGEDTIFRARWDSQSLIPGNIYWLDAFVPNPTHAPIAEIQTFNINIQPFEIKKDWIFKYPGNLPYSNGAYHWQAKVYVSDYISAKKYRLDTYIKMGTTPTPVPEDLVARVGSSPYFARATLRVQ